MACRFCPARSVCLAGFIVLAAALTSSAQPPTKSKDMPKDQPRAVNPDDKTVQRVPIPTADFVELDGTFYRSNPPGRDAPCVMLVHKFNSDRSKMGLSDLAKALQKEGYAVLTFDLRGHGGSRSVTPAFWTIPQNKNGIIGGRVKDTTIDQAKFKPNYLPWLVNDLMAARRFLETKNDAGECNANSLFIVGAGEGASLGLAFMTTEWHRQYTVGFKALQSNGTPRVAGKDIAGGVFLSILQRPNVGANFPMQNWIRNTPNMRDENPMCFVYGEQDTKAKNDVDQIFTALSQNTSGREKHKFDKRVELKNTSLSGQQLLAPQNQALGVQQTVVNYIKNIMAERRAVPWTDMEIASNPLTLVNLRAIGVSVP